MKRHFGFRKTAVMIFGITAALFLVFFIYIGVFENILVYRARETRSYTTITDYSVEQMDDDTAPAGVRTVYRWTLQDIGTNENCLCFYVVHHHVRVLLDDELMYSLMPAVENRIGDSISSNWITVPIYPEDSGKEVTVILTPLFPSMVDHEVEFLFGSHFSIFFDQLIQDAPILFLSLLCILVGALIMSVQLYFVKRTNTKPWDMLFLGTFSVSLGIWRITDLKSAPILFSHNTMVLGYITIGALFLSCAALMLFLSTLFAVEKSKPLLIGSMVGSVTAFIVLAFQVLGIAEFKEMLTLSHILLIAAICSVPIMTLLHRRKKEEREIHKTRKYFLILAVGILLDLISFYVNRSSSDIIYSIIALVVYSIIMLIVNIFETTQKAYTDIRTGLINKARWNELIYDHTPITDPIGIMMLDLNGLKYINDTVGHEAGDKLIFNFSNILRSTLPAKSVICRWGGDEFAVMIPRIDKEEMERYVDALHRAAEAYNASGNEPLIFFAVGYALSAEYPDSSRKKLFAMADTQMYLDKQRWYAEHPHVFR